MFPLALLTIMSFHAIAADPLSDAITNLIANMTVAEKARQLVIQGGDSFLNNGIFDPALGSAYLTNLGAGVLDSLGRNVDVRMVNQVQRAVIESNRHGIGAIIAEECQHGVQVPSKYPSSFGFLILNHLKLKTHSLSLG